MMLYVTVKREVCMLLVGSHNKSTIRQKKKKTRGLYTVYTDLGTEKKDFLNEYFKKNHELN